MPVLTRNIPHGSDLEKKILMELSSRVKTWRRRLQSKFQAWADAEEKVLAYVPETETTRKRKEERRNGLPDYTTIQIPYSFAVVMAAHTYITSVFLNRNPVFQYSARHGETQQQVLAVEALMDYQLLNGYQLPYLYTWLYDALKYGYGVVGFHWDEKIEIISTISEQPEMDEGGFSTGKTVKMIIPQPVRQYAGNRVYNCQPQDFIWDTRYPVRDFQKGEFAGRKISIGWNEVIRRKKRGYYMNTEHIKDKSRNWFDNDEGSSILDRPSVFNDDVLSDMGDNKQKHPQVFNGYELCVEVIPNEWGLGASDWPEKYVFTFDRSFSVLIGVSPLGAQHCSYPFSVIPLEPEGYGLTTRGLVDVLDPVQTTIDWLLNSHFYNVRAALNNKFIVDPSKVVMKDMLSTLPGGIVRLRPAAYGTDPKQAIAQMAVTDVTQGHLANFQMMFGIGERAGGVNDQIMGMLQTGGRKTATEVRTSTSFGINRLKTMAEFASATGWDPLSRCMLQNTQQYYDMELKFKIVGDLMSNAGEGFMMVDPNMIAGFYDFSPVDGTLPIDRFAQVNLWKELMSAAATIPTIGMQYDFAGIFQWVAQLAGLRNITQFKIQLQPDQKLQLAMQQGNSVPASRSRSRQPAGAGGGGTSKAAGAAPPALPAPGLMQ